jgi:hypothetical protein
MISSFLCLCPAFVAAHCEHAIHLSSFDLANQSIHAVLLSVAALPVNSDLVLDATEVNQSLEADRRRSNDDYSAGNDDYSAWNDDYSTWNDDYSSWSDDYFSWDDYSSSWDDSNWDDTWDAADDYGGDDYYGSDGSSWQSLLLLMSRGNGH